MRSPTTRSSCCARSPARSARRSRTRSSTTGCSGACRELESLTVREIHHRVKNNLQTVASLLRLQARTLEDEPAQRALDESVNRILSIAAVHDLATASHDDDIDCADLLGRLEVTLGHGLGGRPVASSLEPVTLSGARANALALVFCELFGNAVEHGTGRIEVAAAPRRHKRRAGGRRRGARARRRSAATAWG